MLAEEIKDILYIYIYIYIYILETKDVLKDDVTFAVKNIHSLVKKQFHEFHNSRFFNRTVTFAIPIKKNNFLLLPIQISKLPIQMANLQNIY